MNWYENEASFAEDYSGADFQESPAPAAASPNIFKVVDTAPAPWRWVCKVMVRYELAGLSTPVVPSPIKGFWFAGSGTLISRRHVLTAAHVIRAVKGDKVYKPVQILVVPGQIPNTDLQKSAPFGVWESRGSDSYVPQSVFDPKVARLFDYGLIKLGRRNLRDLGQTGLRKSKEKFGWFGSASTDSLKKFNPLFGATIATRKVNVAGFPQMNGTDRQMYRGFNAIDAVQVPRVPGGALSPIIRYRIRTESGISGGPVWLRDPGSTTRTMIAIHSGTQNGMGHGVLLRSTIIDFLAANGVPAADLPVT